MLEVGGGASALVDGLLDRGYTDVTVVDLSERALAEVRERCLAIHETIYETYIAYEFETALVA